MRNLDSIADDCMEIVTSQSGDFERERCRTESGTLEFHEETKRVLKLRDEAIAAGEAWDPCEVSLRYGDTIHDVRIVTKDSPSAIVLSKELA